MFVTLISLVLVSLVLVFGALPLRAQVMPDVNGNIYAIAPDNNGGIYIGGNFTNVGGIPRTGLAHIFASGAVDMAWNPIVTNQGTLLVTTLSLENSTLYVGGNFTTINGSARKNIAALNATTAALQPFTVNRYVGMQVMKLLTVNGQVYAAGYFSSIEGQVRKGLAAFDAQTGALLPFTGDLRDYFVVGSTQYDMDVLTNSLYASGTTLYVGGAFIEASGQPRKGIAAFDVASGLLLSFAAGNDMPEYMTTEILGIHQNSIVTRHAPYTFNAQPRRISAFDILSGALQGAWNPNPNNSVFGFFGSGDVAYLGGSFTNIGGTDRTAFAAVDMVTGAASAYTPQFGGAATPIVNVIQRGSNNVLYVGGNFATVNGYPQANLAALAFPPKFPVAALDFTNRFASGTGGTVVWTAPQGGAAGYVVVAVEGVSAPTGIPQNGDTYLGSSVFTGAITSPFNGQVVYDGTATTFTLSGLIPNTNYTLVAFPYNGFGASRVYYTESAAVATLRTNPPPPPSVVVHPGILTVSSATIGFGDVALGASRTRAYTMHCYNLTTASVTITPPPQCEISVGSSVFTAAPVVFTTRATIDQIQIRVRFSPTGNGAFAGNITHTAGSTGATATLTGQSSPPTISTSTLSLNFGAVVPSSSATLAYRLNYRNLSERSITLTPSAGYAVSTTGTEPFSSVPVTIPTATTGRFNVFVKFSPTATGVLGGSVKNGNTMIASEPEVITTGAGEYPLPGVSATRLNFGDVPVGTCKVLSYTVVPAGGIRDQVTIICPQNAFSNVEISTTGANGPFTSSCEAVVFSRTSGVSSARVWVRYCPTTDEPLNFGIAHTSQPGGQYVTLPLVGQGVRPTITVTPGTRNFGTLPLNQSATTTLTVQIRNAVPPATVTLSTTTQNLAFAFLDNATGTYSDTWTTSATATNATYRVTARFLPTVQQSYRTTFAGVVIAQNGSSTDTFTLLGQGRGAVLMVTAATLNFNSNNTDNFLLTPNTRSYVLRYDNITTGTIEIGPTNHPAFYTSVAQNGVFSTTDVLTFNVGGTPTNPVSGNVTVWVRFLPIVAGNTSATLLHNSFVAPGVPGAAEETLNLSGRGLAPFVNVSQASVRFERVPLGETRFQTYTLVYRNITAASITVDVPAGTDIALAQNSSGTWTTAGQTLTIPTVPATTANTLVPLWLHFTPTQTYAPQTTTIPLPHTINGGEQRTTVTDNLNVVITRPPVILDAVPNMVHFGTVAVNGSSTNTYTLRYQNMAAPVTLTLPNGVGARFVGTTEAFQTGTFTFTPSEFNGTALLELRYQPTAQGNLTGNVAHAGGGTSATLQVRGRATTNVVFWATPNPISFNVVTTGTSLIGAGAAFSYRLDVANLPALPGRTTRTIRLTAITPGLSIEVISRVFPVSVQGVVATNEVIIPANAMSSIPLMVHARYTNSSPFTGIIRHEVLDANLMPAQTIDIPVTVTFLSCPSRIDTISVLALYTQNARNYLDERLQTINSVIRNFNRFAPAVFADSRINNLVVKFVNPDGEFVTNSEWNVTGNGIVSDLIYQCSLPNHRLYQLRERLKADAVCVFTSQDGPPSNTGIGRDDNYTVVTPFNPTLHQSVMAVSVETVVRDASFVPPLPFGANAEAIPYTIVHELGHLCGGAHQPGASTVSGNSPFSDGQGFEYLGMRKVYISLPPQPFRTGTIMYNGDGTTIGNGERLGRWSDPTAQVMINNQTLDASGNLVTTPIPITIGSVTQNMRRVMLINGTKMANLYVSTLNPTLTAPQQVRAGQTARIDVTTCEGTAPFSYVWSAEPSRGGAVINGILSNGGQTFEFVMPSGASFVRIRLLLRDATGVESVIERVVEEATTLILAEVKPEASMQSTGESKNSEDENSDRAVPLAFALEQNRPNPCTDETQISFALPRSEQVRLSVYDALGREVLLAFNDHLRAGQHTLILDLRSLPSGVYLYRLESGAYRSAKTMTIVR